MQIPSLSGDPRLVTARLLLRAPEEADAAAVFAMHADAETMRYWSSAPWTEPDQARQWVDKARAEQVEGAAVRLAIVLRASASVVGTCTLHRIDRANRRAEIGYLLERSQWGRGLMQEALGALIGFGFDALDLHRIEADIDPRNLASARSLERHGFVREGFMRERWIVAGALCDTAFYGLLRADWRPGAGASALSAG